jgi:serine/threonine-protein kinase
MLLDGRYRLGERLAGGGMADVWRGTDELLGRQVAVKILRARLAADDADRQRFREEARTAARLTHPGIAAVHDCGEARPNESPTSRGEGSGRLFDEDSVPYLVMELVAGQSLAGLLRAGPLELDSALDMLIQTARALDFAHRNGVVHRDVKPANLMVTPQRQVKVTDFGIARRRDHDPLTATGMLVGTPDYLAPELSQGSSATPQSDVYALGVVAYECLTGRRPFRGETHVATLTAHVEQAPPPLPPTLPPDVAAIVMTALRKDPRRRFATAAEFADALEMAQDIAVDTAQTVRPGLRRRPGPYRSGQSPLTVDLRQVGRTDGPNAAFEESPLSGGGEQLGAGAGFGPGGYLDAEVDQGFGGPGDVAGRRGWSPVRQFTALFAVAGLAFAGIVGAGSASGQALLDRIAPVWAGRQDTPAPSSLAVPAASAGTAVDSPIGTPEPAVGPEPSAPASTEARPRKIAYRGVPDVTRRSVRVARDRLTDSGLTVGAVHDVENADVPAGRVVRTDPPAGASLRAGTRVDLYVSTRQVVVPDLTGRRLSDALDILQNQLRLNVALQYQFADQPAGTVLSQDVWGSVKPDTKVTLTVSSGSAGNQSGGNRNGEWVSAQPPSGSRW